MKFLSDLLVQGDGNEIFLKSADHNISRIIPRGTGANLDKGLFSLYDTGTEDVRIDTAGNSWFNGGNVGIGTASPSYKLEVQGDFYVNGSNGALTTASSQSNLYFLNLTRSTTSLITAGNVGIGLTSPSHKLDVYSAAGVDQVARFQSPDDGAFIQIRDDDTLGQVTVKDGVMAMGLNSNYPANTMLNILNSGNVGIGTTSPETKLHVAGGDVLISNGQYYSIESSTGGNYKVAGVTTGNVVAVGAIDYTSAGTIFAGGDNVSLTTGGVGGSTRIKIASNGNVGIGTTSPTAALHVQKAISGGFAGTIYNTQATGGFGLSVRGGNSSSQDALRVQNVGGTYLLNVKGDGNVGIGTTSPSASLHIGSSNGVIFGSTAGAVGTSQITTASASSPVSSRFSFGTDGTGWQYRIAKNTAGTITDLLTIADSGNVGIGTTNPGYPLDIVGFANSSSGFRVTDGTIDNRISWSSGNVGFFGTISNHPIAFNTNSIERVRITSSGNVGIGTTSPNSWAQLETTGTVAVGGILYIKSSQKIQGLTGFPGGAGNLSINPDGGNVGIGTTSPSEKLHVSGNLRVTGAFVDSSASVGSAGTVLSSTNTGTAWVGASGLPGGPYLPLAGGTLTGNLKLNDDVNLYLGTGSDAALYHNGTNTVFENHSGHLYIQTTSDDKDIILRSDDGSGGVTAYLTVDGSLKKTQFWQSTRHIDNVYATFGASDDLQIFHNGSNSYIRDTGTGDLYLQASDNMYFQTYGSGKRWITLNENASVDLFYNDSKKFETTSTGVTVTGKISGLTAGTANTDAVNVQQLNNATTGALIYKGTWSAAPTTTSVLDGAVSSAGSIVIDAVNPGISVGATITGTGISGTVTVSNIAADGITIAISSAQTIADGVTLTFTTVGGTPDLSQASRKVTGHYYICETAGAVTPNGAGTTPNEWAVGDWATFSDLTTDAWQKIDNSSVLSGAGTGGKVPVWSGTGTSVTLADAPITVSGNNATFAGNVTATNILTVAGAATGSPYLQFTQGGSQKAYIQYADSGDSFELQSDNQFAVRTGGSTAALIINSSQNATFAGAVSTGGYLTLNSSDDIPRLIFNGSGDDFMFSNTANYFGLYNDTDSRWDIQVDGAGTTTFGGAVFVEDDLYLTDTGTVRGKIQLNSSDRDNLDIKAISLGSLMRFYTVDTLALTLDASQNATFAGTIQSDDITIVDGTNDVNLNFGNTSYGLRLDYSTGDIFLRTNGATRLTVANGGNATFAGSATIETGINLESGVLVIKNATTDSNGLRIFQDSSDASKIYNNYNGTLQLGVNNTTSLTLDASQNATFAGNVAMATGNATGKFAVKSAGVHASYDFYNNGTSYFNGGVVVDAGLAQTGGADVTFSGDVGIGTTDPKSKLHVNGGIQMAGDTAAASADKVGTMRYRTGTEYVEVNGTELVTNGDFAADSSWTKEAGWSIASGKASYDASSATNALYQSIGLTTGSVYKLSFTVVDYTSGSFKGHLSNGNATAATDAISANGDYSFNITATGALVLFRNVTSFNGSIDNVSVIEVTAEDASYADMCMQTGSSTYEWVNIVRNTY